MIGQKGIPSKGGGIEIHVEELSRGLVKAGHEVFVFTRPNYSDKNLKEYKGVKLMSLPSVGTKHLDAITHTFFSSLKVVFSRKYDVVHFHGIGPSSMIWLIRFLRPDLKVVSTFHCQDYYHKKWGFFAKMYLKFGEYLCCKLPHKIITVSKQLKKYTEKKYNRKADYIPNGVNVPELVEAEKITEKWGLVKGSYILVVSRLVRHKGIHHLIKAYNSLDTDKKLVITGDSVFTDDYVGELKDLAKDNSNIIFTGKQTGRVLEELFSNAYIFVQPSETEGMSIALLEAMAYSLPVIISDIPENLEPTQGTAFIFTNKDHESLKDEINFVLKNEEKAKEFGKRAQRVIKDRYNPQDITKKTIELYNSFIQ